jgi:hypothetical protein
VVPQLYLWRIQILDRVSIMGKPEDMVTITMSRGQAECVERIFRMFMSKGSRGREFSAWRALRKGLGTWIEEKDTLRGQMKARQA